ncbi:4-hydroxythreonine-4-phosphate dehydrogenase PdxA [Spiribacter sp. C176]|uniref:4-hydroxythreonine-4-phosphate dehydrogenase n=1 Tax=Spiribacter salilacus TaxID=2664894 RepID=A0A6N7QT62_9GAMM|nr:4-hydroxythreonine-4-phosphate dehydrogenase PdxA [Spiribacter salilacus]MRH78599.1 4-hydroxythreonine-4-phosphate dehydrogenase PdxA [Spiribacter salilacus]
MPTRPCIAVTPGEPAGIGPELLKDLAPRYPNVRLVAIADPQVLRQAGCPSVPFASIDPLPAPGTLECLPVQVAKPVIPGTLNPANAAYVLETLRIAAEGCLNGQFSAMVTGPVHKGVINDAGIPFTGHTEYLANLTAAPLPVMMLAAGQLRVALLTTHVPLRKVADLVTAERLERILRILAADLTDRYAILHPTILVAGLNPHAGEQGHLGDEEQNIITPVLDKLRAEGMNLIGPLPADTLFTPPHLATADAVLAMYHDQGLPVLKHVGFGHAVNITLGLPIIRTSVDHGTALDLAGSGQASAGSLIAAIEEAIRLTGCLRP